MRETQLGSYSLVFDFNALCDIETLIGPLALVLTDPVKASSVTTVRAILWGGLKRKHDVSIEQAGDIMSELVDKDGISGLSEKLGAALMAAFPESSEGKAKAAE